MSFKRVFGVLLCIVITLGTTATAALSPEAEENLDKYLCTSGFSWWCLSLIFGVPATHASPATFSNLRWRYLVESEDLKSTASVSSVVFSCARVAGVLLADASASRVARVPAFDDLAAGLRAAGFFGETAALRAGFFGAGDAARLAGFAAGFLADFLRLRGSGVAERFSCTRVRLGDLGAALGLRPFTYVWTLPP